MNKQALMLAYEHEVQGSRALFSFRVVKPMNVLSRDKNSGKALASGGFVGSRV